MSAGTDSPPQVVFVDGIGGRRLFRSALLRHFAARGHAVHYVDYRPSRASVDMIRDRLGERLRTIAGSGSYVVIGYSFGGVLARSALTTLPEFPAPLRLVLVASPVRSLRMCRTVSRWPIFRWMTGDCGQLVASESRMEAVALADVPTTCIHGTRGYTGLFAPAGRSVNDGFVAVAEVDPSRFDDVVAVRASHPFIADCRAVLEAIDVRLSGLGSNDGEPPKQETA